MMVTCLTYGDGVGGRGREQRVGNWVAGMPG